MLIPLHSRKVATSAFTLIHLLVVVAITTLLAGTFSRFIANTRLKATQLQCSQHLRQLGVAAQLYAEADSSNRFPDCTGAFWATDLPNRAALGLIRHGARRKMFYCPAFPQINTDFAWNGPAGPNATNGYRVIGYALAFKGAGRLRVTNITESLTPAPYRINGRDHQPRPSDRVLIADATYSQGANEVDRRRNRYVEIYAGTSFAYRSAHVSGVMPVGGNLVFLDGHTEWRSFPKMRVRTEGGDPFFWW